jgi:hypothetical protein
MNQNKLTFDNENLVVNYISFNIQGFVDVRPIAKYLFQNFGFNSTIAKRINGKWKSESLNYASQNQFQVSFRQHEYHPEVKSFWEGTKVHFSGTNAAQIYKIIQAQKFDWNIFQPYKLSLSQFNVSKQKQVYIKKLIVQEFNYLQEESLIKNQIKLITKSGITQKVDKLIPLIIGQSKLILFYENL